jgi:threonyl-tRNA synthetase
MPTITLPDGSQRSYPSPVDGGAVARSIGPRLERDAVAVRIDGALKDLTLPIEHDARVEIVTRTSADGLELLRHDAAHVMAEAVKELYPETQVTIGPAIENGFYYDFARSEPFTPEDLERIEKRMHEIVGRDEKIVREVWDRDAAVEFFLKQGERYKAEIIGAIPAGEPISLYRQGAFIDLCRGPHLPSTGRLGAGFKLMKLAGAYWRGDSRNEMLQRIYGTAWADAKELKAYLDRLEEAERRDHRKIGKQMDLFHFQDEAVGAVFWHTKGWQLFRTLVEFMRTKQSAAGYREVNTPELMQRSLWEASGHWATFRENMFTSETAEKQTFVVKPMNCPGHIQVFKSDLRRSALPRRRVRQSAPLRTFGRATRTDARAGVHARRCSCVLHRSAGHRGSRQGVPAAARHLPQLRLRQRAHEVRGSTGEARRRGRRMGPCRGRAEERDGLPRPAVYVEQG